MSQSPAIPTFIFRGHETAIHALHFFSHNDYLASGDSDGWIVVWSTATKRPLAVWKGHEEGVMAIDDWAGDRLMSHGRDHFLRVWQLRSQDFEGLSVKLPADGASSTGDQQPWLLYSMAANALNYCAFSKCVESPVEGEEPAADRYDPLLVATPNGLDAGGIDIFQLPSQQRVNKKPSGKDIQTGMVMALAIFHHPKLDQLVLVAGYESGHVVVHLRESTKANSWQWKNLATYQQHSQPVLSIDVTLDYGHFFSSSADAFIAKYALPESPVGQTTTRTTVNTKHAGQQDITLRDDGKIFATAGWDKRVRVYSQKTLKELAVLKWHQEGCYAVAFASIHARSEATSREGFHGNDDVLIRTTIDLIKERHSNQARSTHWLAAGGKDGKISLWEVY